MPYITKEQRKLLNHKIAEPETAGELNYLITVLLTDYISKHGLSYTNLNAAIGALECSKAEFYRRVVVPYEELKMRENGDVYNN